MNNMGIVCPVCGEDDDIAKLAGIVAAGTTKEKGRISTTEGSGYIVSTHITELAKKLSPRYYLPKKQNGIGFVLLSIFLMIFLTCGGGCTIHYFFEILLNFEISEYLYLIGTTGLFIVSLVLAIIIDNYVLRTKNQEYKEKYDKDMIIYNDYMKIWNRCYYCQKDNIVFDSKTGKYGQPGMFP